MQHVAVADKDVDTAAQLAAGLDEELSPEEATRIRKKIDWHILPLMCSEFPLRSLWASCVRGLMGCGSVLYWIQFMDKTTLGSSAILGIR